MPRGNAALTIDEVRRIKRDILEGVPRKRLARRYEVGLETIARIARGDTWRDIPAEGGAYIDKLQAEMLAPANLSGMTERLLAIQPAEPIVTCPHCRVGVPKLGNGRHFIERLNMELDCG